MGTILIMLVHPRAAATQCTLSHTGVFSVVKTPFTFMLVSYALSRYSSYSSETALLLPGNRQPGGISMLGCFLAFLVISSVVYYTSMYFTGHPLYTSPGRHEEERQKHHLFWGHVEAHMCTTYATREYTAQLMNLPVSWKQRADACMATPLEVQDRKSVV